MLALPIVQAESLLTFKLIARNGKLEPSTLNVPAGQRFKIEIDNQNTGAIEFESLPLRQEKVLGPGAKSFVVIHPLKPGSYKYFDDYHQATSQGQIVAK
ncbi:cupredoxin domain-containing protein [Chitinivorax sp. B]|uniref:cupredoxin domain-containing protein n=1 Tax=Chitinivorax sp. B TaxID=2502235 RepID=UPI002017E468|nr:cupredoxin domain-containing protein [Chitinivorax sp. B]